MELKISQRGGVRRRFGHTSLASAISPTEQATYTTRQPGTRDQYASNPTAFLHCSLSSGRSYGNAMFQSASWPLFTTNVIGSWLWHERGPAR